VTVEINDQLFCEHAVIRFGGKGGSGQSVKIDGKWFKEYVCDQCGQRWLDSGPSGILKREVK